MIQLRSTLKVAECEASTRGDEADRAHFNEESILQIGVTRAKANVARPFLQDKDNEGKVICKDCTGRIPESRLKAMPFAVRCRECEEAMEAIRSAYKRIPGSRRLRR